MQTKQKVQSVLKRTKLDETISTMSVIEPSDDGNSQQREEYTFLFLEDRHPSFHELMKNCSSAESDSVDFPYNSPMDDRPLELDCAVKVDVVEPWPSANLLNERETFADEIGASFCSATIEASQQRLLQRGMHMNGSQATVQNSLSSDKSDAVDSLRFSLSTLALSTDSSKSFLSVSQESDPDDDLEGLSVISRCSETDVNTVEGDATVQTELINNTSRSRKSQRDVKPADQHSTIDTVAECDEELDEEIVTNDETASDPLDVPCPRQSSLNGPTFSFATGLNLRCRVVKELSVVAMIAVCVAIVSFIMAFVFLGKLISGLSKGSAGNSDGRGTGEALIYKGN